MEPLHNARIKHYPDGSAELLIGSRPFGGGDVRRDPAGAGDPVFSRRRWAFAASSEDAYVELERDAIAQGDDVRSIAQDAADAQLRSLQRSVRRAKRVVRDLARSNDWTYFVTLTLDPGKVNRYDPGEVLRHLRHWLGNNVRRRGLRYVLVPEHHKDGAIHFHGLFNDALEAVDSGTMSVPGRKAPVKVRSEAHKRALERAGGHTVYNLPGWGWGFSTAIELYGEMDAAISYVCKYIGKEMGTNVSYETSGGEIFTGKIGGRWYYSGGDLQRPAVEWFDVDVREWEQVPGWFRPESFPAAQFLALRISAAGEVLDPYVKPGRDDAEHGRGRNPEEMGEIGQTCGDVRTGGQSSGAGDFDRPGGSFGLSAEAFAALQACEAEQEYDELLWAILSAEKGTPVNIQAHLTKSGLSSQRQTAGVEGVQAPLGQNDP